MTLGPLPTRSPPVPTRARSGCVATAAAPYWGPFEQKIVPAAWPVSWLPREAAGRASATGGCVVEFVTRPNNPDGEPYACIHPRAQPQSEQMSMRGSHPPACRRFGLASHHQLPSLSDPTVLLI